MIKKPVKKKNSPWAERIVAMAGLAALLAAIAATGFAYVYGALAGIWYEQCRVTDKELDVVITTGNKMVYPDAITLHFGLTNGANLATIPFASLRAKFLERIPNVRNIKIERRMPNRVTIDVEEREPIARIAPRSGAAAPGRVADADGVVFWYNANTALLPIVREAVSTPTLPGKRLSGSAAAALRLVRAASQPELASLRVQEIETHHPDYLLVTFGNYDRAKIAWDHMHEDTRLSRESLHSQLTKLSQVIATRLTPQATIWLATDWGPHGRITASGPNNRASATSIGN
jgi:hypothetical protein